MKSFASRIMPKAGLLAVTGMLVVAGLLATQVTSNADSRESATKAVESGKAKPTIVLVHGAWADSSGWSKVIRGLRARGYDVLAPPTPLRGLRSDSKYLSAFLRDRTTGPVVLVGHSYGGAVITTPPSPTTT